MLNWERLAAGVGATAWALTLGCTASDQSRADPAGAESARLTSRPVDAAVATMQGSPAPQFVVADGGSAMTGSADYPCSECHDPAEPFDLRVRALTEAHDEVHVSHGGDEIWCLDCHHGRDRDRLLGPRRVRLESDQVHRLCARCHSGEARDFRHGVHGKRLHSWRGERVLQACTSCHSPHSPALRPRRPAAPPKPRTDIPAPAPALREPIK